MDHFIVWFQQNWVGIIAVYLLVAKFITGLRDVLDKTPAVDDNIFEKICTVMAKLADYLVKGQRPK
jgi:hypothetical protein